MIILRTISELRTWRNSIPANESVGFVPTMGALHAGHAKLLEESAKENQHTVLSIFVNPTQFAPTDDLAKYPRTFEADCVLAEKLNVAVVFNPTVDVLYPAGYSTYVTEEKVSLPMCGKFRPGHFKGVTTIVLKLFNLVQPVNAYFGLKDAQQFLVLDQMVRDLNVPVKMVGVPTVREESGLALSSRNVYLSDALRAKTAPLIYQTLLYSKSELLKGHASSLVIDEAKSKLTAAGFDVQYFELQALPNLNSSLLAVAAFLPSLDGGKVRLIDNLFF